MAVTLYEIVRQGETHVIVDEWIETYKANRETALVELINFIIQSSGCNDGVVTTDMYASLEHSDIITRMAEEIDEDSREYPLIMYKEFKTNFSDFIQVLVRQCQDNGILYDQHVMEDIILFLTGLSGSRVCAFRHTSTLAAMKLMIAYGNVAALSLENAQRERDARRQKRQRHISSRPKVEIDKRNLEESLRMIDNIFKRIFVKRYRDAQPEIRAICVEEMCVCMQNYSHVFLNDRYLKYVGWKLDDDVADVRLTCLVGLQNLYRVHYFTLKLENFTNRFKDRIVAMTRDKETDVAVQAIRVVTFILKCDEDILVEDCNDVCQLVYSASRAVAQAAAEFLNEILLKLNRAFNKRRSASKRYSVDKRRSANASLIKDLALFFIESEPNKHAAYLVDALWEVNEMVKDWDCMTELLIDGPGRGEKPLTDKQETALIKIMVCVVRQAAQGRPPVGRKSSKKMSAKEKKTVQDNKMKLSQHFMVKLPDLLSIYGIDSDQVANLLEIPQHFDLEIYTTSGLEVYLDSLLRQMKYIVKSHTETEVLEACSKTYKSLLCDQLNITHTVEVARTTLFDSLAEGVRRSFKSFDATCEPDENVVYDLSSSLNKITVFYSCHDLTSWNLYDILVSLTQQAPKRGDVPEDIYASSIVCAYHEIMWSFKNLKDKNTDRDEINRVKKHVTDLVQLCTVLLIDSTSSIKHQAFITISDLLVVFSKNELSSDLTCSSLIFAPSSALELLMSDVIEDEVFVEKDDDDDDEVLHKRRNLLSLFSKLIISNIIDMRMATCMFKHYIQYYNDYGAIIKRTLAKSREIDKISCAKTLGLALRQLFFQMKGEMGYIEKSKSVEQMNDIKKLARRFSLTFGREQVKSRDAMTSLHKDGIVFSLTTSPEEHQTYPYIDYLDILGEFSYKLTRLDKRTILIYLVWKIDENIGSDQLLAVRTYRNSLSSYASRPFSPALMRPKRGIKRKLDLSGVKTTSAERKRRKAQ